MKPEIDKVAEPRLSVCCNADLYKAGPYQLDSKYRWACLHCGRIIEPVVEAELNGSAVPAEPPTPPERIWVEQRLSDGYCPSHWLSQPPVDIPEHDPMRGVEYARVTSQPNEIEAALAELREMFPGDQSEIALSTDGAIAIIVWKRQSFEQRYVAENCITLAETMAKIREWKETQ